MRSTGGSQPRSPLRRGRFALTAGTILVLAAFIALAVGTATAAAKTRKTPKTSGATFSTSLYDAVSTFNPFLAYYVGETEDVLEEIYPTLTWLNASNQPVAYLARSWSVSPNKLTWTFHLKAGLKWSDGVPLTAKDVAWTYNLMLHNSTAATANGDLLTNFKSVTAPNDTTVKITTKTPQANMLTTVAVPPIVPEHIWKSKVKKLGSFTNTQTPVVGYGPYEFTEYAPNQYVVLKANPDFFMGASKYKTIVLNYYATTDASAAAIRSGAIDETDNLTATEWKSLSGVSGIKTFQTESNTWEAVELNADARTRSGQRIGNGNPALANSLVRRAISMGIDRKVLVQKVLDGTGSVGSSYIPPAFPQWKWTPTASESNAYNPTEANKLLTEAGYPLGKNGYRYSKKTGKELTLRFGIHSDYVSDAQIAEYMVPWMKDIGIKLDVQTMSDTQLNDDLAVGDWDMLLDEWSTDPDPTQLLSIQTCSVLPTNKNGNGGDTDSFFCNKRYDQLYNAEQSEFNASKREADVRAMEKILYNANYDVMLFYPNTLSAVRTAYTKGYVYGSEDSSGFYPFQNEQIGWLHGVPTTLSSSGGSSSDTGLIIGIIVVVIVLGGAGAFMTTRKRRTADERE